MKRVIRFSRLRVVMGLLSGAVITAGIVLFFVKGINYGIDFRGGLSQQIQIAPVAMHVTGSGADSITASSYSDERELLGGNAIQFVVVQGQDSHTYRFAYADYATLSDLAQACATIPGVSVSLADDHAGSLPTNLLYAVDVPVDIVQAPLVLNRRLEAKETPFADIQRVREALSALGQPEVQALGAPADQQFILRVGVPEEEGVDYRTQLETRARSLLSQVFDADQVLIRRTDFVGPSLAGQLASQTTSVVIVALVLMLIYLTFRFRFERALATVLCVVHDSAVMVTVTLALGLEFSTSVVAAILTIIGYSVNDTIVIFDRVRENTNLMRDADETLISDTSITQTLGRTLITSFVTLLSVVALYIFTSGSLKDFSLLLIVGILVGTYSTIYIASPIVMLWHKAARTLQRGKDARKFGAQAVDHAEVAPRKLSATNAELAPAVAAAGGPASPAVAATGAEPRETAGAGTVIRQQPSRKKKKRR